MRAVAVVVLLAVLVACARGGSTAEPLAAAVDGVPADGDRLPPTGKVMAAALVHLVTTDEFGQPTGSTLYLIQDQLDPGAGGPAKNGGFNARRLTSIEKARIVAGMSAVGPVMWIHDSDHWVDNADDLRPRIPGSIILGVGEPQIETDSALVPVSLWCGGLCGVWLTYRLRLEDAGWEVTGVEGPVAVS